MSDVCQFFTKPFMLRMKVLACITVPQGTPWGRVQFGIDNCNSGSAYHLWYSTTRWCHFDTEIHWFQFYRGGFLISKWPTGSQFPLGKILSNWCPEGQLGGAWKNLNDLSSSMLFHPITLPSVTWSWHCPEFLVAVWYPSNTNLGKWNLDN